MQRRQLLAAALAPLAAAGTPAFASTYPDRPIRMVVPFPPGGGTDILARLVASEVGQARGWTIVADNRAGAGGTLGIAEAVRAAPSGYEMVMGQKDNLVVAPWLYKHVSYDPARDLAPVAHVAYTPVVFVVRADSPLKTLADVVRAAKSRPGQLSYGSPGNGTTIHLSAELFKKAARADIAHVPYKGSNPALLDVLAGNIDLMASSVPSVLGQIKAGKLRALAVTSARRSSSLPAVPTIAESGYPDFDVSTWYGLFMPAGAPQAAIVAMHEAVNALLAAPHMRQAVIDQGAEPLALSRQQLGELVAREYRQWERIVRESGAVIE
ncbi:MAG: tripartite tricarboxylate transporter substrate binding protein [Comamonas sp.]